MSRESANNAFWTCPEGSRDAAEGAHALVRTLQQNQSEIQLHNIRNMRLYGNRQAGSLQMSNHLISAGSGLSLNQNGRLTLNVVKSAIDTLVSKIAINRVRPMFLTDDAPYERQYEAQTLTKFTTGLFYQTRAHAVNKLVLRDAAIGGTGFAKVSSCVFEKKDKDGKAVKDGRITLERVIPDEILVDENDAYYGTPSMLFHVRMVSTAALKKARGADKAKLAIIEMAKEDLQMQGRSPVKCCMVLEAWVLADESGNGGRHMIALENGSLYDDDAYTGKRFPLSRFAYTDPVVGYFGTGIAEMLTGVQIELNRILMHVQQSMKLLSNPRVYVESGSSVNNNKLTNEIGGIVPYTGQPPIIQTVQSVHPELFQQIANLRNWAFEEVGISQLAAQSKNPLGANASGRALREMNDQQSERFTDIQQKWDELHIDEAELALEEAARLHKDHGIDYVAKCFDRRDQSVQQIKWSDIKLGREDYVCQVFAASALPREPGARLATIAEMRNAGDIDPETAIELMDFPDLDRQARMQNAPTRWARSKVEKMIREKRYLPPEPHEPVGRMMTVAQLYYNDAKLRDASEDILTILRTFIDNCTAQIVSAQTPPAANTAAPAQQLIQSQLAADPAAQAAGAAALVPA